MVGWFARVSFLASSDYDDRCGRLDMCSGCGYAILPYTYLLYNKLTENVPAGNQLAGKK